jgi:hypothetical protein
MTTATHLPALTLAELLRTLGVADDDDTLPRFWD